MDFQSAMDTFVEAWMAANTKPEQIQSQALALTHKASPPSRPTSVSPLPRSPQSHQSQQSQPQNSTQPPSVHPHQSQTPLSAPQTPYSAHNQHPKQEANASPKQEGFDLSKSTSNTGKNLPVHCVVETIHNIVESHVSNSRENWRRPQVETDSYVIIPVAMPFQMTLLSLCRGGNDLSEETKRNFESWLQQQQLGLGLNPMVPTSNHHHHHTQSPQPEGGGTISTAGGTIGPPHPALLQYSHKTRMRTSFDPELELPRLQRWFGENQHPSRQQIQHYVSELNALESRRGRKPLDVNNVVYWFKNARAAQKRAENRGVNGYSPPGLSPRGASVVSEDCTDEEDDSRNQSTSPSPCPPGSPPVGPLSLTTRPEDQQPPPTTPASVKQEDARVSSGSEDEETRPTGPLPPGFSLVPSPMFGHGIMYMSPYLPPRGPAGCSTSMLDERRKRNRTFIDPVTEVPRLEAWFTHNTHPSHALILKYTEELNRMPYRQKFPRLEPKNVQFWFKNRRAKCKRLKMALFEGEAPQPHPYHAD
ncbi:SATB1_N and homeodomain domain-containing protein dve isoform X3 [Megachile rotundata]|uniref:SATB1_N and homeodomain domain-containing protein dve isoform X3 n=1 Tax=Megachile rotundata TaxID=143995 RepID=UPI0006150914|nr:PREDICTED: uncharacterized protein LOC100881801 isoform X3 [Megachile rotundata]